jgi:SET domain
MTTYEEIMGLQSSAASSSSKSSNGSGSGDNMTGEISSLSASNKNAVKSLSKRLTTFRKWLTSDANVSIHPAVCMVNGEATDGTRNAPVLVVEKSGGTVESSSLNGNSGNNGVVGNGMDKLLIPATSKSPNIIDNTATSGRIGTIDGDNDIALYDRTMGCCVRVTRELKPNEVIMSMPRSAMITPDLVAASDAGRAILGCCKINKAAIESFNKNVNSNNNVNDGFVANSQNNKLGFWDAFENTTTSESKFCPKIVRMSGPQVLVKILQERKKAEGAYKKSTMKQSNEAQTINNGGAKPNYRLAECFTISTRAPFLAFLIHQRFSNAERPKVISYDATRSLYNEDLDSDGNDHDQNEFQMARVSNDENALSVIDKNGGSMITLPPRAAETFAPYARTLPTSVSLPLCWKRNELALLANCIPGVQLLQDVATTTSQLVSEFIALLDAGIVLRFPRTFPEGLLTWDRWVWAAAVFTSRLLPASCYLNAGDEKATNFHPLNKMEFQSPARIWDELGVLIPLLDMLNHEIDENQITWQRCATISTSTSEVSNGNGVDESAENLSTTLSRAIIHKKVKKGCELYTCYGHESTSNLILRYGFAQLNATFDEVRMGWALPDAVGNVTPPAEYIPDFEIHDDFVFESSDEKSINSWWSADRIVLLERNVFAATDNTFRSELRAWKKITVAAHGDGTLHPILLSAIVIATMPDFYVKKCVAYSDKNSKIIVSKRHQQIIQRYLQFSFTRKLEKLLQNLDNGVEGSLWFN